MKSENFFTLKAHAAAASLPTPPPWREGQPVRFCYMPGGLSQIMCGFRENEHIQIWINCDERTPRDLQESFNFHAATQSLSPWADLDHERRQASIIFPRRTRFLWGTHGNAAGVIIEGGEPTSLGSQLVNGRTYASWSPEFVTDADYANAVLRNGRWTFPEGVRGSYSNPARPIGVGADTLGGLVNAPAFHSMPRLRAHSRATPLDAVLNCRDREIAALGDMQRRESERRGHEFMKWFTAHKN